MPCNILRIDLANGSPVVEYRITNDRVESRTVRADNSPDTPSEWQRLTAKQLTSHVLADTALAYWLRRRMGVHKLVRACAEESYAREVSEEPPSKTKIAKPLILCIEDNENYLSLRKTVLERDGFNVLGASTGEEALEILREAPVCLTISDHMLRGMTGVQLAKQMKALKPDVPIVIHSGCVPDTLQNVDAFINKGEATAEFLRMIHDLVRRFCAQIP
jgi:two-component system, OmpR family, response regulator CpxR